jgi:hypothetical protein
MRTFMTRQFLLLAIVCLSALPLIASAMRTTATGITAAEDRCPGRTHRDGAARHLDYGSSVACDWGFGVGRRDDTAHGLAFDRGRAKLSLTAMKAPPPAAE